jgi:hypothetical protein
MSARAKNLLAGLAAGVLVLSCWPRYRVVVPAWTITVLRDGRPVPGAMVREVWQDYSVEGVSHEEDRYTDRSGRVRFPERFVVASTAHRTLGCFAEVLSAGVHASCGPSAFASAYFERFEGWANYEPGTPLPAVISLDHER